jgi:hypothetical protein
LSFPGLFLSRVVVAGLGCLASLSCARPSHASSAAAWAAHRQEVVAQCSRASGLSGTRLVGSVIEFDDRIGTSVALISGTDPQAPTATQRRLSLCLFDRRTRTAQAAPADGWR